MPSYRHHDFGNLYIQFDVKFPERLGGPDGEPLSEADRQALERILPPRKIDAVPPPDAMIDDFTLEDVDPIQESARARGMGGAEDDDDDMHPGAERVQCASQ
jgi:DnaJ homolog subfamily A member 2